METTKPIFTISVPTSHGKKADPTRKLCAKYQTKKTK